MTPVSKTLKAIPGVVAILLAALLGGCDAESPTEPVTQTVPPPPAQESSSAVWNITVTASPSSFEFPEDGSVNGSSELVITARRADNGSLVPQGTTALLSTTRGTLTTGSGTATSVPIEFGFDGTARATLNFGGISQPTAIIVRAQIESSFGTATVNISQEAPAAPFQVLGVSPSSGPPSGGTPITITGSGFEGPIRVSLSVLGQTFVLADARLSGSSRITATTPAINLPSGQNAAATITVENAFDAAGNPTGVDSLPGAFTYTRSGSTTTLKIISVSPTFGPNEGGTEVEILGEGFGNQVKVYFTAGPLIEATVVSISPTRIVAITPSATGPNAPNANQIVDVRVEDPITGFVATRAAAFQYGRGAGGGLFISSIAPSEDEYLGGILVTIFGQGFDEPVAVSAGQVGQQVISVSGTEIVFRTVPVTINCNPVAGAVSVTNIETAESTSGPAFTYRPVRPTIVSVSPDEGPEGGGNQIVITGVPRTFGQGFVEPVRVEINGTPAQVVSLTPSGLTQNGQTQTITVTVPEFTGDFDDEDCQLGNGQTGTRDQPARVDVSVTNLDTGCEDVLQDGYQYNPAGANVCSASGNINASFSAQDQGGGTVNFTDTSTTDNASIISWFWDFGDGDTSTVQNPIHTYTTVPNTYTVILTVQDDLGRSDQTTQDVQVN